MWSDIWNVSYIELRIWNQVTYDHRRYERNLSNCAWKSQDFTGVWTRDLAIPVRRSNQLSYELSYEAMNWAMKPLTLGAGHFGSSNEPVKNGREVIYEMFHILNCGFDHSLLESNVY